MSAYIALVRGWWERQSPQTHQRIRALGVLILYTFITLAVTWPLIAHPSRAVPGYEHGDQFENVWSLWYTAEAILHGENPAYFSTLVYPQGYFSPIRLTMLVIPVASAPLTLLTSPTTAYNLVFLISYITTGYAAYLLCRDVTDGPCASVLGGLVLMLFPAGVAHALAGHLGAATLFLALLYMRALRRTLLDPEPKRAVLAGVLLALASMVHITHLPYLLAPWTVLYVLHFLLARAPHFFDWPTWRGLLITAGVAVVVLSPFFAPFVISSLAPSAQVMEGGTIALGADVLSYITPSPDNPLLGRMTLMPAFSAGALALHPQELIAYLGIIPLALASMAITTHRTPEIKAWLIIGLIAVLFALGPYLKIGGETVTYRLEGTESYVVLPYAFLTQLPIFEVGRTPGRFNLITGIVLAILAAQGAAAWLGHKADISIWRKSLLAIGALLLTGEYLVMWPLETQSTSPPAAVWALASESPTGGILNVPLSSRLTRQRAMLYQTIHAWPIMDGYVTRTLPNAPGMLETLEWITEDTAESDIIPVTPPNEIRALLEEQGVAYVLEHRLDIQDIEGIETRLSTALGDPITCGERAALYQVEPGQAPREITYALSGWGWGYIELWSNQPSRWLMHDADLVIYTPYETTGALAFRALSGDLPRRLQITINNEPAHTLVIAQYMDYILPDLTLHEGYNTIHFESQEPCWPIQGDARCRVNWSLAGPLAEPDCWLGAPTEPERCVDVLVQGITFVPDDQLAAYRPLDIRVGEAIQLRGYSLQQEPVQPGATLTVTLVWQALDIIPEDYILFVHLFDPEADVLVTQYDSAPLRQALVTSQWQPGEIIQESIVLPIPANLQPGTYTLLTGMYRYPSLERLPVQSERPYAEDGLMWLEDIDADSD